MNKQTMEKIKVVFLIATALVVLFNTLQMGMMKTAAAEVMGGLEASETADAEESDGVTDTFGIIPAGIPDIYGEELGVSFDDVSTATPQEADATIKKLGLLDTGITLSGDDLSRYITIASEISCEYCCGAPSIITSSGQAACGCAHSYAMRGLAKYLITQHGDEYADDEILEEMGKWKTLFFPGIILAKAEVLQENGIELNYINLASNKYRGIETESSSGSSMVGGC